MDNLERMKVLVSLLNKAAYDYYVDDNPTMSDDEYDKLYRELTNLENMYPDHRDENSPTQRVADKVLDKFDKITHNVKMMSIDDVFNVEEVKNLT